MIIFAATLSEKSPRYADWLKVFGTATVPLETPCAVRANLPGLPGRQVYKLNLRALTAMQRMALIDHLSLRFGIPASEVATLIDESGVPILAEDVMVTIDAMQFL